jgi:CDP-diacylglycerol--glycerol-3-phosphate 3-phosphatidyltransferase
MSKQPLPLTLANRITVIRILSIPFFILLLMYYGNSGKAGCPNEIFRWAATICYLFTFLSDAVDGYLARSRHEITRLGSILDPLADKALLLSGLILLSRPSAGFEAHLPMWFVILAISRDVVLVVGAIIIYYMAGDVMIRPRISGKAATFFQMTVIAWILIGFPMRAMPWLLGAAAVCTGISAIQYIFDGIRQIDQKIANGSRAP